VVIFERRTMQRVGAALDLHVDHGAPGQAQFWRERVRDHIHSLERFKRRNVSDGARPPDVRAARAVDARICSLTIRPVDIEDKRPRRIAWNGNLATWRREA